MGRHYRTDIDRPPCTVPGCPAPATLAYVRYTREGHARRTWRRTCAWHHRHPNTLHPTVARQQDPRPSCGVHGCTQLARPLADGRFAQTCRSHALRDLPSGGANPHVLAALAQLSPRERKAANVRYDPVTKTYRVGARPRQRTSQKKGPPA